MSQFSSDSKKQFFFTKKPLFPFTFYTKRVYLYTRSFLRSHLKIYFFFQSQKEFHFFGILWIYMQILDVYLIRNKIRTKQYLFIIKYLTNQRMRYQIANIHRTSVHTSTNTICFRFLYIKEWVTKGWKTGGCKVQKIRKTLIFWY